MYPNLGGPSNFPRSVEVTRTAFIGEVYTYIGEQKINPSTILLSTKEVSNGAFLC